MSDDLKYVVAVIEGFVWPWAIGLAVVMILGAAFVGFVLVAEAWQWLAGIFG